MGHPIDVTRFGQRDIYTCDLNSLKCACVVSLALLGFCCYHEKNMPLGSIDTRKKISHTWSQSVLNPLPGMGSPKNGQTLDA